MEQPDLKPPEAAAADLPPTPEDVAAAAADPPATAADPPPAMPVPWPERFQAGVEAFTEERIARETAEAEGMAAQERVDSAQKALTAAEAQRDTATSRAAEIRTSRVQKARDLRALLTEFIGD